MKTIQKAQTTIQEPYDLKVYSVIVDGEVVAEFHSARHEHPHSSQRAFYDNLKAYYTRTGVEFEEL